METNENQSCVLRKQKPARSAESRPNGVNLPRAPAVALRFEPAAKIQTLRVFPSWNHGEGKPGSCATPVAFLAPTPSLPPHPVPVLDEVPLTPELLLRAYANGLFPMGDDDTGAVRWYSPNPRGILPLDDFHVPDSLARRVRNRDFSVTADREFEQVIAACADRTRTWITPRIQRVYVELHEAGYAHSVECWQDNRLAGGLYGVSLGGAFFGESMFYRVSNASKVALVHLVRQMRAGGFILLDTQYSNPHLEQFGCIEIPRDDYEDRLADALCVDPDWWPEDEAVIAEEAGGRV